MNKWSEQNRPAFLNTVLSLTVLAAGTFFAPSTEALTCGNDSGDPTMPCDGAKEQFAGGFQSDVGFGGFGGGECQSSKTPVVYIHGNGDLPINFAAQTIHGQDRESVYTKLKAAGYNDCELFGVSYLSENERETPATNYHRESKQVIIANFIDDVLEYTGAEKVDIVAHSLGVSMSLSALHRFERWNSVRRFVNISGAIRGLNSCYAVGNANALASTCASQNYWEPYTFGFHPDGYWTNNDWTGASGIRSMRQAPLYNPEVDFYTINAGEHDQVLCATSINYSSCDEGSLFQKRDNVRAQLDIGSGTRAVDVDFDFSDGAITNLAGGDLDGIGHFGTRLNAGPIIVNMLTSDCSGEECAVGYQGRSAESEAFFDSKADEGLASSQSSESGDTQSSGCMTTKAKGSHILFPLFLLAFLGRRKRTSKG